ncbi:hypothetical protein SteCoe_13169 [Stentor coeruleus]|uniref:non-specific serine/threonine protein kinase n=1 Tax=Stentor coeruleus TaxID=5963 RepID=A0A1R2C8Z1_9CILI|nr:hypothetical protein SteCoe_13169 [Stentor coeruleus]
MLIVKSAINMGCACSKIISNRRKSPSGNKHREFSMTKVIPSTDSIGHIPHLSDYISLAYLGSGGFAEVIASKHKPSQTIRALKIISKNRLVNEQYDAGGILKECIILQKLNHPNILKFYEYFIDEDNYYLATEICKGGSLYGKLRKVKKISEGQVKKIMFQIFEAIEFIHSLGIAHRDLKPENILLLNENTFEIKIGDFGNACNFHTTSSMKGLFGSVYYLAPEVFKGIYNEKVDIWSCGIMLYVLLTGNIPYNPGSLNDIKKQVVETPFQLTHEFSYSFSGELEDFMKKILNVNPEKRLSASEALKHPWFDCGCGKKGDVKSMNINNERI